MLTKVDNRTSPACKALLATAYTRSIADQVEIGNNPREFSSKLKRSLPSSLASDFQDELTELKEIAFATAERHLSDIRQQPLADYLAQCLIEEQGYDRTKLRGAIFTPSWLARHVTLRAAKAWSQTHRDGRQPKTIADLSCGVGTFLSAAEACFRSAPKIIGFDVDARTIQFAMLFNYALKSNWRLECSDSLKLLSKQKTLFSDKRQNLVEPFDILLGNPPYVRVSNLDQKYANFVRSNYESVATGNFDLSVAFIESAIENLKEDGIFSYVLTSKFSQASYGREICKRLASDVQVINIEHYGDRQLFDGYTTYVLSLTVAKRKPAKKFSLSLFSENGHGENSLDRVTEQSISIEKLKSLPWDFTHNKSQQVLEKTRDRKHPLLTDIFGGIFQGIRTGANDVFVVDPSVSRFLENELLLPFVTGRQIKRFSIKSDELKLLYPYEINDFGEINIRSENILRTKYPLGWKHLRNYEATLTERENEANLPWFAFSRSQNLSGHRVRKIFIKEMMARAEFAADYEGSISFGSGYALDGSSMSKDDLMLWTAVLNTPTLEFVLRFAGTQLHSGWFRLLKHHLNRVRLPHFSKAQKLKALKLARECKSASKSKHVETSLAKLDAIVAGAFDLTREDRSLIQSFLFEAHSKSLREAKAPTSGNDSKSAEKADGKFNKFEPVTLGKFNSLHRDRSDLRRDVTFQNNKQLPVHRWYPYTQGFSAPLVDKLLNELSVSKKSVVLDPFAGSGTTNLVCWQRGLSTIGLDISPLMTWIGRVKTTSYNISRLKRSLAKFDFERSAGNSRFEWPDVFQQYFTQAYSERVMRQILTLASRIKKLRHADDRSFFLLALVSILESVSNIRKHGSHYRFLNKPESIGLQKLNIPLISSSADIGKVLRTKLLLMIHDLETLPSINGVTPATFLTGDARKINLAKNSVDLVITSPPYLNRNNYIAQQKAELYFLGLIKNYAAYKTLVKATFRSHTDSDLGHETATDIAEINTIIKNIVLEDGNNPKIPDMICGYFNDLKATLESLFPILKSGGKMAFVVGNTRWGGVVIPIDHILLLLGETVGFKAERVLVTRLKGNSPQQMRRYGRIPVRESIVILRKP